MRAEHRAAWIALALLALVLAGAATAHAQDLYGSVQVQFQRVQEHLPVLGPGGLALVPFTREQWLQTYNVNHQAHPRDNMLLQSSLRLSRVSTLGRPDALQAPLGSVRFIHPLVNLSISHQPTRSVVSTGTPGVDTVATRALVSRAFETLAVGHVEAPRGPQLDLTWVRRRREIEDGSPSEHADQRQARVGMTRDAWSAYASIGDQRQVSGLAGRFRNTQRLVNAGGTLRPVARRTGSVSMVYDFGGIHTDARSLVTRSSAHSASLSGEWRPTARLSGSLLGTWRRNTSTPFVAGPQDQVESGVLLACQASRALRVSGGGGLRTVLIGTRRSLLRYVTAVTSMDGHMRPGWTATASASHTTNWDPVLGPFSVETAGGSTRMRLGRRADFDGTLTLAANGDTAHNAQRLTSSWSMRLGLTPLRTLLLAGILRSYRVGRGLLQPTGIARGRELQITWRPLPALDLMGDISSSGLLPDDSPRQGTRSLTLRFTPSPAWQATGAWTRSTDSRPLLPGRTFSGREFATGRLQWTPVRRLSTSVAMDVADPGQATQSRQYDALVTWSFGR